MSISFINPLDLTLTPPMDLNSTMNGIDKISPFPMQLRTRGSVGLFGARRDATPDGEPNSQWLLRMHQGVDLLAPVGTKVFAAAPGLVKVADNEQVTILHDYGFTFFTNYAHLKNVVVKKDASVKSGELIGEVNSNAGWPNEPHLHFELRYPFTSTEPKFAQALPVDATFAMYYWEVKSFQNDGGSRITWDNVHISSMEEIVRARKLRFLMLNVDGHNRDLFLPLQTGLPEDESLANTIKECFLHNKKVRIVWRESLFFSNVEPNHDNAAIIAEIKAYR